MDVGVRVVSAEVPQVSADCPSAAEQPFEEAPSAGALGQDHRAVDVVEIRVGPEAPIAGKTIEGASEDGLIASEALIITIERGEETITPSGETTIQAGDFVTVLSRTGLSDDTLQSLTGQ